MVVWDGSQRAIDTTHEFPLLPNYPAINTASQTENNMATKGFPITPKHRLIFSWLPWAKAVGFGVAFKQPGGWWRYRYITIGWRNKPIRIVWF